MIIMNQSLTLKTFINAMVIICLKHLPQVLVIIILKMDCRKKCQSIEKKNKRITGQKSLQVKRMNLVWQGIHSKESVGG